MNRSQEYAFDKSNVLGKPKHVEHQIRLPKRKRMRVKVQQTVRDRKPQSTHDARTDEKVALRKHTLRRKVLEEASKRSANTQ